MTYLERHHDYVLGPNQDARLASVAAGSTIQGITLALDADAPFALRSRAMRVKYSATRTQAGLNHLLMRWAGPNRDYTSQDLMRQSLLGPYFGQLGNPIPVNRQVIYPSQGQITVDISNDGSSALTNLTLYFRGVKLFRPGEVKSYNYPQRFSLLTCPNAQSVVLPVVQPPIRNVLLTRPDADWVLRGIQAGDNLDTVPANEVFIKLFDEDEKPYSNDAVHIDVIAGNSAFGATYPAGSTVAAPVGAGPNSYGLFYPEIYIPKNHQIYYNLNRDDSSYGGAAQVTMPITFQGAKVFTK